MLLATVAFGATYGSRIHVFWRLVAGIGVAQVLRPARLCGWAPGLILKSIGIIGCVRDPKLQAPLWDLFVFSPVAPSSFGSRTRMCLGRIRKAKFDLLASYAPSK